MQWSPRRSELRLYVCGFCEVESARGGHGTRRAITARVRIRGDTVVLAEEWRLEIRAGSTSDPVPVELERGGWRGGGGGVADTCRRRGWAWAVCPVFDRRVWRRCLYGGSRTRHTEVGHGSRRHDARRGYDRGMSMIGPWMCAMWRIFCAWTPRIRISRKRFFAFWLGKFTQRRMARRYIETTYNIDPAPSSCPRPRESRIGLLRQESKS